jgi:hypothetical protein
MESPDRNQEHLAHWVDRELRRLPLRRAPQNLEARVLAAIAQRASLPWWRQHFLRWPLAARIGFLLLSALIARLLLQANAWLVEALGTLGVSQAVATPARELRNDWSFINSLNDTLHVVLNAIPAPWLYGSLAVIGLMYATLFGIGSVAYRTLNQERS